MNPINMSFKLYYFHDPMCSWCWGFRPFWSAIVAALPERIMTQRILGGLAADTDQPMPVEMQVKLQQVWKNIQHTIPETAFNFDFWEQCTARRSTYPACRAVIAARKQGIEHEESMILAIQRAYYVQAKNPSDADTLVDLARDLGLNVQWFTTDLHSSVVDQELQQEIAFARQHEVQGFPTLLIEHPGGYTRIMHDYKNPQIMIDKILELSSSFD